MIGALFALQVITGPACGPVELCRLLEAAAAANQAATLAPGGYRAVAETENAMLGRWEGRIQGATLLEQTSSEVRWTNDEGLTQRVNGARSFPNAIPLSRLVFMKIGWVVPTLTGQRLSVIPRNAPGETQLHETLSGPLAATMVVHPLATDRGSYYRYTGGRRERRTIDGTAREIHVVEVTIAEGAPGGLTLFEGEMDLDPRTFSVVRLFGKLRATARHGGRLGLSHLFEPSETLVDLISEPLPGSGWVPRMQRFEIQGEDRLAIGFGSTRRVISRFHDARALPRDAAGLSITTTTGYSLTAAPRDSMRRFGDWRTPEGSMTDAVSESDFGRFRPDQDQPGGTPQIRVQGHNTGDFFRVNRIEGPFTGASLLVRMRDKAPGVSLRAAAGYAWSEKTVRGALGGRWATGGWMLEAGGVRVLEVTNDFRDQFDNPNLSALFGQDPWDYVDRVGGGVAVLRRLDHRGSVARLEVAGVDDRAVSRHMDKSLMGKLLRDNRTVTGGEYFRTRLLIDWNPAVSPLVVRSGIGFRLDAERAIGELDYTRLEARVVARKRLSPFFLLARLHWGAVFADRPPPQQLFELGGAAGFPGYDYKEFAGNRAVLFRARVTYPLPVLDTPLRLGKGVTLPALAPAVSVGFQTGLADANSAAARAAVRSLGDLRDDESGELVTNPATGLALPVSVPTDRLKTSVDIRIGVFGDALGIGLARALSGGRATTFFVAIGRQF